MKLKRARLETNKFSDAAQLSALRGVVKADAPNNNLHKFNGAVEIDVIPNALAVSNDNVLLRGCILRNTECAFAITVYTGADTKVMLNGGVSYKYFNDYMAIDDNDRKYSFQADQNRRADEQACVAGLIPHRPITSRITVITLKIFGILISMGIIGGALNAHWESTTGKVAHFLQLT